MSVFRTTCSGHESFDGLFQKRRKPILGDSHKIVHDFERSEIAHRNSHALRLAKLERNYDWCNQFEDMKAFQFVFALVATAPHIERREFSPRPRLPRRFPVASLRNHPRRCDGSQTLPFAHRI